MHDGPKIRSLERGLKVMRVLSLMGELTVSEAARQTQLPRQTVSRILFFLEDLGYVERKGAEKRYRLSDQVLALSEGVRKRSWITHLAKPKMDALCRDILWPVVLAVPRNLELEIVYDTDPISPLVMRPAPIGLHIPLVTSVTGRVYLAHCSKAEYDAILKSLLRERPSSLDNVDLSPDLLKKQMLAIRKQGFFCAQMPHKAHSSLVAPVFDASSIKGVLSIRFPIKAMSVVDAIEQFAPKVKACADTISMELKSSNVASYL
jgi:IclR family transcriptional regulator, mhp operon transcriptional activator